MDYLKLWGKTDKDGKMYPLICHMLDSSAVGKEWLYNDTVLLNIFLKNSGLEIQKDQFINLLSWLVAMHDIGKATVCFQNKVPDLAKQADIFDQNRQKLSFKHGLYGAYFFSLYNDLKEAREWNHNTQEIENKLYSDLNNLRDILNYFEVSNIDKTIIDLLKASCWHHGDIFNSIEIKNGFQDESDRSCANKKTVFLRDNLVGQLTIFFRIKELNIKYGTAYHPSLLKCFAGFVSVCDWIASGEDVFDGNYNEDLEIHFEKSCLKAKIAFDKLGIINIDKNDKNKQFSEFFTFIPRGIQTEIENIINKNEDINLLIIEAPTGEGKTEAALYSHYRFKNKGLYFALPSQATANQMFKRIKGFYENQIKKELPIILAHGMAWLNKDYNKVKQEQKKFEENSGYNSLNEWFFTRKKTLLAPVGVGTVDQAMLSVLKTKHYFVKLFALAGKTLIIDEVHAYDFFMMPIIKRLLEWCYYLNIKVILLSATLPQIMKKELLSGYLENKKKNNNFESKNEYPLITAISSDVIYQYPVKGTRKKEEIKIKLLKHDGNIETIVSVFKDKISNGGNILWICNTVKRSQDVYNNLKKNLPDDINVILFHSRFTYIDRNNIETKVTGLYGKDKKNRPFKSIAVSTQVVEQSLDVDFDYLISDIAPIDLLLQRFGRMHRHERSNRPDNFNTPETLVLIPDCEIKGPIKNKNNKWNLAEDLKGFAEVYNPLIIYKTIKCLSENEVIKLPDMYRELVESVYTENNIFIDTTLSNLNLKIKKEVWENSYKQNVCIKNEMEREASKYITESPSKALDIIEGIDIIPLFEEEGGKATSFIAKTRYGNEIGINLIITKMTKDKIIIGTGLINLIDDMEEKLTFNIQKQIIENSVKMSSPKDLVMKILKKEIKTYENNKQLDLLQEEINKIPALRNHFIVVLNDDNLFKLDKYDILYLKETGLQILKEEEEE